MNIKVIASGSTGNCYHVSDGKTELLIDVGIPLFHIRKALDFKTTNIEGVLISHNHADHCKAVPEIVRLTGLRIYAPNEVFNMFGTHGRRCIPINPMDKFSVGSFDVLAFDCEHDVPNLGYLIRSRATGEQLLYYTDTAYLKYTFPGIDYLMGECNYSLESMNENIANERLPAALKPRILKSHMSIETYIDLLRANGYTASDGVPRLKQIYLLHLSNNNSNAEDFRRRVQELCACEVYIA